MNEKIDTKQNEKIGLMEIFIPLFCLINQYEILGVHVGLICVIVVVGLNLIKYRQFYVYKPLFIFFLFMLLHDILRTFITGFNMGLWVERLFYLLLLSCVHNRIDDENLYKVWKCIGIVVMAGLFFQSFQVYILGQ